MKSTLIDEGFSIFVKKEFANEIEDLLNELKLKTQKIKFTIDEDIVAKIIEEEQENMLSNSSIYNCIFEIDNVSKFLNGFFLKFFYILIDQIKIFKFRILIFSLE